MVKIKNMKQSQIIKIKFGCLKVSTKLSENFSDVALMAQNLFDWVSNPSMKIQVEQPNEEDQAANDKKRGFNRTPKKPEDESNKI